MDKIKYSKKAKDILNCNTPEKLEKELEKNGITEEKVKSYFDSLTSKSNKNCNGIIIGKNRTVKPYKYDKNKLDEELKKEIGQNYKRIFKAPFSIYYTEEKGMKNRRVSKILGKVVFGNCIITNDFNNLGVLEYLNWEKKKLHS